MSDDALPAETAESLPDDPDIFEQMRAAQVACIQLLGQLNIDAALEIATDAVRTSERLSEEDLNTEGPEVAALLRTEFENFRFIQQYLKGLKEQTSRDFFNAKESFETAIRISDRWLGDWMDEDDMRRPVFEFMRRQAEVSAPLSSASESFIRGDPNTGVMRLNDAETIVEDLLRSLDDGAPAPGVAEQVLATYAGFFVQASIQYAQIGSQGHYVDGAAEFFERHEPQVRALLERHPDESEVLDPLLSLLGLAEASKPLLNARIALRDKDYDASLQNLQTARAKFREMSRSIPRGFPFSDMLREICINQATNGIPQLEQLVKQEKEFTEKISFLEAKYEDRAREWKEAQAQRDAIIKEVARPFGDISIRNQNRAQAQNSAQLQADLQAEITNSISMNVTLQNKGIDEVLRALEDMRGHIPQADADAIRQAAEDAKQEDDLAKKVEKVANVIDAFGKVAGAASELVPYGRTAFRILRGIFA